MSPQIFRDFQRIYPVITRGKGVFLYDQAGREYLDAVGGIAVVNVGHGIPEIIAAMKLARQYHVERGRTSKYRIISRWTSYHGNTIGALSMSGRTAWRGEFVPYLQNFPKIHPPYIFSEANVDQLVAALEVAIQKVMREVGAVRGWRPPESRA